MHCIELEAEKEAGSNQLDSIQREAGQNSFQGILGHCCTDHYFSQGYFGQPGCAGWGTYWVKPKPRWKIFKKLPFHPYLGPPATDLSFQHQFRNCQARHSWSTPNHFHGLMHVPRALAEMVRITLDFEILTFSIRMNRLSG